MENETPPYHREDFSLGNGNYLSERQVEVLRLLAQGYSNKQIAHCLGVAEPTIKMHVSSLLRVLKVQNRVQILLKALELNFVALP